MVWENIEIELEIEKMRKKSKNWEIIDDERKEKKGWEVIEKKLKWKE